MVRVFSRRTAWSVARNRIAAAVEERRGTGRPVLDLTETNPTRVGLPMPAPEIRAALADARILQYEPTAFGNYQARAAVSSEAIARGRWCESAAASDRAAVIKTRRSEIRRLGPASRNHLSRRSVRGCRCATTS